MEIAQESLGRSLGSILLSGAVLVTRLEPGNADPEALPRFSQARQSLWIWIPRLEPGNQSNKSLGRSLGSILLSGAVLVTRLEPGNADPEALPPFPRRGRASGYGFPGWSLGTSQMPNAPCPMPHYSLPGSSLVMPIQRLCLDFPRRGRAS